MGHRHATGTTAPRGFLATLRQVGYMAADLVILMSAPSRIRTCDLLLRSNPGPDAVAISGDAGHARAVRVAVAQVIWSSNPTVQAATATAADY